MSTLVLFLELLLVRWIGTEVRIFAFLGNLILLVSLFGTGLGCFDANRRLSLASLSLHLAALTFLLANPFRFAFLDFKSVTDSLAGFEDSPFWDTNIAAVGVLSKAFMMLTLVLYLVLSVFVPAGRVLGRVMQAHPRIVQAYSLNIAGSLAGIWMFSVLSWLETKPVYWFGACTILILTVAIFEKPTRRWGLLLTMACAVAFVWFGSRPLPNERIIWSPYEKLKVDPLYLALGTNQPFVGGFYSVEANGTGYQMILNLSDEFIRSHPDLCDPEEARLSHYNLAFYFRPNIRRLLIVGAGTGNNAAAALRHGVEQIDCVEIDPEIYALGKELHPEHPYDSPRVHMYVTDARAFLKRNHEPYDMIWFALLDAHPGSSYNNRRVDQYVYTLQSFQEARRLLAPGGVLLVNFSAIRGWIGDRLHVLLSRVFSHPPLAFWLGAAANQYGASGELTLVAGDRSLSLQDLPPGPERDYLASKVVKAKGATQPTTDDWPYLYLQHPSIPKIYWISYALLFGIIGLKGRRIWNNNRVDWHFFALGAAFLLTEVQAISRAMLLFGTMWTVNAIAISAVLFMILFSNLIAWRWPQLHERMVVAGLGISLVALATLPLDWFNTLHVAPKLIASAAFLTAPVFFAGLIFIRSFSMSTNKARALGSNLIGALLGGLLESLSFITGIRALVFVVALFYVIALYTSPLHFRSGRAILR